MENNSSQLNKDMKILDGFLKFLNDLGDQSYDFSTIYNSWNNIKKDINVAVEELPDKETYISEQKDIKPQYSESKYYRCPKCGGIVELGNSFIAYYSL